MLQYNVTNWVEGFITTYTTDKYESLSELSRDELAMLLTSLDDRIYDLNNKINKHPININSPLKSDVIFGSMCNELAELTDMKASVDYYYEQSIEHYSEADLLTCNLEN